MIVRELIEHLKTLPQDSLVVYKNRSDFSKLEADDIRVVSAADKEVVQHHNMPDQVREYHNWEYEKYASIIPKFLDAVIFPGN